MEKPSLRTQVVCGSAWMLGMRAAQRSIGLVSAVVLARILTPEDFGVVAVGVLCVSLIQVFSDAGVRQNLIQNRHHSEELLWTAWTVEVFRGMTVSVVIFLLAPLGARFFHQPDAGLIIRGLGLLPLIHSVAHVKVVYFQRELDFRKVFIYQLSGMIAGFVVAVAAAVVLRNAWALVFGQLAAASIPAVLSYVLFPEWPRFAVDRSSLRQLYAFGKWMFLATTISYFNLQGDRFFVGRLFDADVLGMYTLAVTLTGIIVQEFGKGISSVLFPAYARIKDDLRRLSEAFAKSYELLLSVMVPTCLGLALVSDDLVSVVFGDRWSGMSPILKLLALAAVPRVMSVSGGGLFLALSRPKYNFICEIARGLALLLFLLILPPVYGVSGVIWALLVANLAMAPVFLALCRRLVHFRAAEILRIYATLVVLLVIEAVAVMLSTATLRPGVFRLLVGVLAGLAAYLAGGWVMWRCCGIGPAPLWYSAFATRRSTLIGLQLSRRTPCGTVAAVGD